MRVWRVSRAAFADLSGEGARLYGGRWNSPGRPMVYTAENPALAILEVRVHLDLDPDLIPDDYVLMEIDVPEMEGEELAIPPDDPGTAGDDWLAKDADPEGSFLYRAAQLQSPDQSGASGRFGDPHIGHAALRFRQAALAASDSFCALT